MAQKTCDVITKVPDGINGFLFKNSDHNGSVVLLPAELPNASRVVIWKRVKQCKKDSSCKFLRKKARLIGTGRANGNREHWREQRLINQFPTRRLSIRAYFSTGEGTRFVHCFNLNKVHPERND